MITLRVGGASRIDGSYSLVHLVLPISLSQPLGFETLLLVG